MKQGLRREEGGTVIITAQGTRGDFMRAGGQIPSIFIGHRIKRKQAPLSAGEIKIIQALLTGLIAGLALGDPGNETKVVICVISTPPSAVA